MSDTIEIKAEVLGAERVSLNFNGAADRLPAVMRGTVQELGLELLEKVKAQKLTGQVLRVKTGRLRRSISMKMSGNAYFSTASVGTNVVYGRFWELGFNGTESVRAHTRHTSKADVLVRAHTRRVNLAARPFLQPALAEMRARVLERLTAAAGEVARGPRP